MRSVDPNSIQGPSGFGSGGFVQPELFSYGIEFENKPTATAPAQTVVVTQQLDSHLDWSTFQLGNVAFGDTVVSVPSGLQSYSTTIDLTATLGIDVQLAASFNALTGLATWDFTSIDPATMDVPANPLAGFLPPDVSNGEGLGFVNYTIQPKSSVVTGEAIGAEATVVFDQNAPLTTAAISNTIDNGPPTSSVAALPAHNSPTFTVSWSGADDSGGSGIASYDVYVSDNGGSYTAFQTGTTATSASFTGQVGHTYSFYSVATDNVGNVQVTPASAQATTMVAATGVATTTAVRSNEDPSRAGDAVTFTAAVAAAIGSGAVPGGTVQFQVDGVNAGPPVALVGGSASYTTSALTAGNHSVSAAFNGPNGAFLPSTGSLPGGQTVTAPVVSVATTTTVSASATGAVFGQTVTFTAVVSPQAGGSNSPTGVVTFLDGSAVVGSASLVGGTAQVTSTSLGLGSHAIRAVYAGAANFVGSQSGTAGLSVQPDGSTIVLTPSANPSPPKAPLRLTATVGAAAPGGGTPTGTVTFYNGKKALGTAALSGGVAILTTTRVPRGNHPITVIYHGDADFTATTSAPLHEAIKKVARKKKAKARVRVTTGAGQTIGVSSPHSAGQFRPIRLSDLALEAIAEDLVIRNRRNP